MVLDGTSHGLGHDRLRGGESAAAAVDAVDRVVAGAPLLGSGEIVRRRAEPGTVDVVAVAVALESGLGAAPATTPTPGVR